MIPLELCYNVLGLSPKYNHNSRASINTFQQKYFPSYHLTASISPSALKPSGRNVKPFLRYSCVCLLVWGHMCVHAFALSVLGMLSIFFKRGSLISLPSKLDCLASGPCGFFTLCTTSLEIKQSITPGIFSFMWVLGTELSLSWFWGKQYKLSHLPSTFLSPHFS